jgi:hypothetical protein
MKEFDCNIKIRRYYIERNITDINSLNLEFEFLDGPLKGVLDNIELYDIEHNIVQLWENLNEP